MKITVNTFPAQDQDRNYQILYPVPIFFTICDVKENDEEIEITETSPTYLCRDLLGRAVIAAHIYDVYSTKYTLQKMDTDVVYLAVGVNHSNHASINCLERLQVLHDLEDRLGFRNTNGFFVSDKKFIHRQDNYLPDSPTRCILELDGRWLSNTVMMSILTGIIRAIIMNPADQMTTYDSTFFLKTLDRGGKWSYTGGIYDYDYEDEDDALEKSYLKYVKIMDLLIDNYDKLFGDPKKRLFGTDMSIYHSLLIEGAARYTRINNQHDFFHPLYKNGCGIRWFLNGVYNNCSPKPFKDSINTLSKIYRSQNEN